MDSFETTKFLEYICEEEGELLGRMRHYARENDVPIIRRSMKQFLETMVMMNRPKRILEIGTAIGYSSITIGAKMLTYGAAEDIEIITIERSDAMYGQAIKNVEAADMGDIIRIRHDEAEKVLRELAANGDVFDMIFMDAAKGQYLTFLPYCLEMLRVDGILLSDNVLQNGDVAKSRFSVPRRQRTIHQRMREYLYELNHRDDLQTSILDIADGTTISVKLK